MVIRRLLALLLAAGALLIVPPPATAQVEVGRSASIAGTVMLYSQRYVGEDGAYHYQLWVRHADGSRTAVVTDPWLKPFAADLSPDGRWVAMTVGNGSTVSTNGIYVTGVDGSGRRNLIAGNGRLTAARNPDWSPDGKRLVFVGLDTASQYDLWSVRANGKGLTRLTRCNCAWENRPQWSPDGSRVLWSPHTYDVEVLDPATGTSTSVYDHRPSGQVSIHSAIWGADGQTLLVTAPASWDAADIGLYSVPVSGGRLTPIATRPGQSIRQLVASPDGAAVGFTLTTSTDSSYEADLAWIELAPSQPGQPPAGGEITVAPGPLAEELLAWTGDCACEPGGRFSALSLHTTTAMESIQAAGGLLPGLAGQRIRLVIEHKPHRKWRPLQKLTTRTSADALYYADLRRSAGGLCRVTATWPGGAGHQSARTRSKPFAC